MFNKQRNRKLLFDTKNTTKLTVKIQNIYVLKNYNRLTSVISAGSFSGSGGGGGLNFGFSSSAGVLNLEVIQHFRCKLTHFRLPLLRHLLLRFLLQLPRLALPLRRVLVLPFLRRPEAIKIRYHILVQNLLPRLPLPQSIPLRPTWFKMVSFLKKKRIILGYGRLKFARTLESHSIAEWENNPKSVSGASKPHTWVLWHLWRQLEVRFLALQCVYAYWAGFRVCLNRCHPWDQQNTSRPRTAVDD